MKKLVLAPIFAAIFTAAGRKTLAALLVLAASATTALSGCGAIKNIDTSRALQAGMTAVSAASITDAQVVEMCRQAMEKTDSENAIAPVASSYGKRLAGLTKNLAGYDGLSLNFAIYIKNEVNAFASGDGSVRVYTGLMDAMDDDQLMAIIGHEIGHVKNHDVRDAVKNQYMALAATQAVGALGNTAATLSDGVLGQIAQSWMNARYSQKQENEADDYGFQFTVDNDRDPYAMARSMARLLELSGGSGASSGLVQAFSSHPDTASRLKRMTQKAEAYAKIK